MFCEYFTFVFLSDISHGAAPLPKQRAKIEKEGEREKFHGESWSMIITMEREVLWKC